MAVRSAESLDGYLIMAHGSSAKEIAERRDAPSRWLTMSDAMIAKAYTADRALTGRTENPAELKKTELLQRKAKERMLGLDPWDPAAARVPHISKTVVPHLTPSMAQSVAPAVATTAASRFDTISASSLEATRKLSVTSANALGSPEHARSSAFSKEFNRGL